MDEHAPQHTVAVFPGTFDPVTIGHLDIIRRAATLFSRVVVGVGHNPEKGAVFSSDERVEMIADLVCDAKNVEVRSYSGLTMAFVRAVKGQVIVRGIRDSVDLRDEIQFANVNLMVGNVETVFLMTTDQNALTSSSLIKQVVELGGADFPRLAELVPPSVVARLKERLGSPG